MTITLKHIITRTLKWSLLVLSFLLLLIIAIFLLVQTRFGQDLLRDQAVKYLSQKLNTRIALGRIDLDLKNGIRLTDLLIEDRQKRTLASVGLLDVRIHWLSLLSKQATLERIELKNANVNIFREAGSESFNFAFIPEAFITTPVEPKNVADSTAAFLITLGEIHIESLQFLMDDQQGKQKYTAGLGSLKADLGKSDINALSFHASYLYTRDVNATMQNWGIEADTISSSNSSTNMHFQVDTAALQQTVFSMDQEQNQMKLRTSAALLTTASLSVDLHEQLAKARSIRLTNHTTSLNMASTKKAATAPATTTTKPFRFSVDTVTVANNGFSYHDNTFKKTSYKNAFDPNHLQLEKINLALGATSFDGTTYRSHIRSLTASEAAGFSVRQLSGTVAYADSLFVAKDLLLQTAMNRIEVSAQVKNMQAANKENIAIQGTISTAQLQLKELLYFQPELANNKYVKPLLAKQFNIDTRVDGTLGQLFIPQLTMKSSGTSLAASAEILHATDPAKMIIRLNLNSFTSSRQELLSFLPRNMIADSLLHYIPKQFSVSGTYRGVVDDFNTDLKLSTSLGNARIKGSVKQVTNPAKMSYDLTGNLTDLDLGQLLEDTTIGKISGSFQAKGKGVDISTANATVKSHIERARYRGYDYSQIDLSGTMRSGIIDAKINSADPNLDLDGTLSMDMAGKTKRIDADVDIRNISLHNLHLMADSLTLNGKINTHFPEISEEKIVGDLTITESLVSYRNVPLALDTITLSAQHAADTQYIALHTPFADGTINGKYRIQDLPPALMIMIQRYARVGSQDSIFSRPVQANLDIQVHLPDSLVSMVDGVKSISPFNISAEIDSKDNAFNLHSTLPSIRYQDLKIDTLSIFASTSGPTLSGGVRMKKLEGPSYELNETLADFSASRGIIDGNLRFQDENNQPRYNLPFVFTNDPARPFIRIRDSLLINKKPWSVNPDNIIYLNPDQLRGSTFFLSKGNSSIGIKAMGDQTDGLPIELDIRDFNISNITDILISDTALATGIINGKATFNSLSPLSFTTSIKADSLTAFGAKLGTLALDVDNKDTGLLNIKTSLQGDAGFIHGKGTYVTATEEANVELDIKELHLAHAEPFVKKYLSHIEGRISGALTMSGKLNEPDIRGTVRADTVEAIYAMTGTFLRIPEASFIFDENGVRFDKMTMEDSIGHKGLLNGRVNTKNYTDFDVDLTLEAKNFEVVGRKKIADQGIYGPTNADLNINLKGNLEHLNLEGKVNILDRSEFTYVYRSEVMDQIGDGLIEFFDPTKPEDTLATDRKKKSALANAMDMNLYINITPASTITIITDEVSGDHLIAKGKADLNYVMKAGVMELLGTYELDGGEYDLSLGGLVRKTFKIEKGSTISWSGDPLKGRMDITAKYQLRAAAGPLLNDINHIPGIDKQKLNFQVLIMLKKELLKPDISFKLDMPEADQQVFDGIVYSRIKQVNSIPAELNKQVMGLLAFGQFIAENPFNSLTSSGGDFQTQAFNTAGQLLTQELTNLVGRYVKDVNIDFGLEKEKDYTSGQEIKRTDLKVGVSKSFANNRLNVYVGSNFALEGTNQNEDAISGIAGDITMEYLLTPDGKYRLKGYRLTDNELVFQGSVVRTGLSFALVLEFNNFKDLRKQKNKKKPKD